MATILTLNLPDSELSEILTGVFSELNKAEEKHPDWPNGNIFEQVSIISEEAGEVAKAVNDRDFLGAELEAKQTIVVCLRFLLSLKK